MCKPVVDAHCGSEIDLLRQRNRLQLIRPHERTAGPRAALEM